MGDHNRYLIVPLSPISCTRIWERGDMPKETQSGVRGRPNTAASLARRRRAIGTRRAVTKTSARQSRLTRSLFHIALALATGLLCVVIASRIGGRIAPPYAATLGTLVVYPPLATMWRRLPLRGRRGR